VPSFSETPVHWWKERWKSPGKIASFLCSFWKLCLLIDWLRLCPLDSSHFFDMVWDLPRVILWYCRRGRAFLDKTMTSTGFTYLNRCPFVSLSFLSIAIFL
jgi:hypothetical protein